MVHDAFPSFPPPKKKKTLASTRLVPGLVLHSQRVQFGDTEARKGVDNVIVVCKVCTDGEVDTAARREGLGVVRPDNGAIHKVGEGAAGHPLHGDSFDLHPA